ncbi:Ig-like domain repeat protein, partial [Candidatus Woesearchaeota archaeon]|nr:Ig-like domain repeat protein [Candidatus Woesearchaeota archaeon]
MIVLVINLTLYSSLVIAAPRAYPVASGTVTVDIEAAVSGSDGIANFKKEDDSVDVDVKVKLDESWNDAHNFRKEQINGEIIPLSGSPALQKFSFNTCEAVVNDPDSPVPTGSFICSASIAKFKTQQQVNVKINLNDSAGNLIPLDSAFTKYILPLFTDDKLPQINLANFNIVQNPEGTFLEYDVTDPGPSAGIARIELREGKDRSLINITVLDTESSTSQSQDISMKKTIYDRHKITSLKQDTDNRSYELTVIDKLGKFSSKSIYQVTDYHRPEVIPNTFGIYIGNKLAHRLESEKPTSVNVSVIVREETDNLYDVTANLTQLDPANVQTLGQVTLACSQLRTIPGSAVSSLSEWNCGTNVTARLSPNTKNVRVRFNLKDGSGNENAAEPTYELSPETTAPLYIAGSFKAVVNGVVVHDLAPKSASVDFEAKIREEFPGMDAQDAILDLSSIDGSDTKTLKEVPASKCVFNETLSVYSCGWNLTGSDVIANPNKASGIVLNVRDNSEKPNSKRYDISYQFNIDDVAPEIRYLGTASRIVEGMNVNFTSVMAPGKNNLFIAEITEAQSGISKENVELSLDSGGFIRKHPDQCKKSSESNGLYICIWNSTMITSTAETEYKLQLDLSDNAYNPAATKLSKVYLDHTAPIIEEVDVASISQQGPVDYHQSGDVLRVTAIVRDVGPVKMFVDLSNLNAENNLAVDCKPEKNPAGNAEIRWVCTADSKRGIGVYGDKDSQQRILKLVVNDSAGNQKDIRDEIGCSSEGAGCTKLIQKKVNGAVVDDTTPNGFLKVDVLKIDSKQSAPDFWEVGSIAMMPQALDRETFDLINARQYFSVRLSPLTQTGEKAEPVDVTLIKPSCKADESDAGKAPFSIVKSFDLQNNKCKLKDRPVLFVEYQRAKPEFNELKFTCTFSILTKLTKEVDGSMYFIPQPEFQNVTFATKWFDLPIGTIDAGLRDQIEHEKKAAFDDLGKTIDVLSKAMAIAKGICQLFGTLMGIVELIMGISAALEGLKVIPPAKPGVE